MGSATSLPTDLSVSTSNQVLVLGVNFVGKTMLCQRILLGKVPEHGPVHTVGFNIDPCTLGSTWNRNRVDIFLWEQGGQCRLRPMALKSRTEKQKPGAMIFMVDGTDPAGWDADAKAELEDHLHYPSADGVPLLLLINKCDLESCADEKWMLERWNLHKMTMSGGKTPRPWMILRCSAKTGEGVDAVIAWIHNVMLRSATEAAAAAAVQSE